MTKFGAPLGNVNAKGKKMQDSIRHMMHYDLNDPDYKPNVFLNRMQEILKVKSDNQLAHIVGLASGHFSRVRNREFYITAIILVRFYDLTGLSINELRNIAGIKPYEGDVFLGAK